MSTEQQTLRADRQMLELTYADLQDALTDVVEATGKGDCPEQLHAKLENQVRSMYRLLTVYRDHDAVTDTWADYDLDLIPQLCAQRIEVNLGYHADFGVHQGTETRIKRAPLNYLIKWATAFKRILKNLDLTVRIPDDVTEEWEL